MFYELVLLLIGLFLVWHVRNRTKYHGYPPGPFRFPLIGNLPQLVFKSKLPSTAMRQLAEEYGDVMYVQMGMVEFVVFSSYSSMMELFSLEGVSCNRFVFNYISERSMGGNVGLVTSNPPAWQCLRRFTIRSLREFGFGKSSSMDGVISEEVGKFLRHFHAIIESSPDGVMRVDPDLFDTAVLNVLWRLVTGKSSELDDERTLKMIELSDRYLRSARVDDISVCYPVLRDWFPNWTKRNLMVQCTQDLKDFIEEIVKEHEHGDYENPQCFIEAFLGMIEAEKGDEHTEFNRNQMLYTLLDLFQAGSETTSKTLTFALIYMILHPDKQERLHAEIDSVLSAQENATLTGSMKSKFPFASAVLLEAMRMNAVAPIPAPYVSHEDFIFRGYRIAKGTPLMTNLEAVHYQKSIWGDPDTFRPERFLNAETGELDPMLLEYVIPFGKSKRLCLGQSLAETTLFLYFTTVMRQFKFEKTGTMEPSSEAKVGLTYTPKPFQVKVSARKF